MLKKIILSYLLLLSIFTVFGASTPEEVAENIHWFGQACIKIETRGINIYIDPYKLTKPDKADIILITHKHMDHYSKKDIARLKTSGQVIVAPFNIDGKNQILTPGKSMTIKGIKIEAVPAYNIKKKYHPKSNNWVGYIITIDGVKVYHAGDTERIPEMKSFTCDIALIPLGQTYTMNSVEEAVESVMDVKASIAIPIHFGTFEGTEDDAKKFVAELKKLKIKSYILEKE